LAGRQIERRIIFNGKRVSYSFDNEMRAIASLMLDMSMNNVELNVK
jgi:hypothetical protein